MGMGTLAEATDWPAALEEACVRPGALRLAFQPIVDLNQGAVCGYEALTRFDVPGAGTSPAAWFAAAAEHGMSARLEAEVVRRALAVSRRLPRDCFLSLNVSPEAVLSPEVQGLLAAPDDLRPLVLEVTEQTPVEDYDELDTALRPLRDAGALIAVDDTGAGYASLRHVLALAPDFVKLDRSLVENLHAEPRRAAAVSAIGALAGELDARVVAEGIENGDELASVVLLDVPLGQGYLLGRPAPDMAALPAALEEAILGMERAAAVQTIGDLAEGAGRVRSDLEPEASELAYACLIERDEADRPVGVRYRTGGEDWLRADVLSAQTDDDVPHVALRAMARADGERFAPVLCCDIQGHALGVVRMERILEALARAGPGAPIAV
jgi:EAL domain-containing protein (putative c-di-GMP-specific phosphodiesterase class I)